MSNKRFVLISLMVAILAVLMFAGSAGHAVAQTAATAAPTSSILFTPVATMPMKNGKPQELHIYNYTTYIADDTVSNFEKLYNVKVTYDTYTKPEELYAKLQAGNPGYDIVVPPDYMVRDMIKANLLETLDLSKIPNFTKNVSESFKNPPYDPGNKHSVAYQWGTIGIGYNPAKVKGKIDSWKDLFDKSKVEPAHTALLLATRETIATFLITLGKDPNSTKQEDLDAVKKYLLDNKDMIAAIHDADGQFRLAKGEFDIISDWSGDMYQVIGDPANKDLNLQYVIPKEGAVLWTDNLAIPKGAPNKELAHVFINYVYDAQVGASISNYIQYASPNQAAIDMKLIDEAALSNPSIYPPPEVAKNLKLLGDIGDAQSLYDQTWADITAGLSK
jgi:spermidine/putrescine transport system substrate-binding protein